VHPNMLTAKQDGDPGGGTIDASPPT
jgi:hypothetical protein